MIQQLYLVFECCAPVNVHLQSCPLYRNGTLTGHRPISELGAAP